MVWVSGQKVVRQSEDGRAARKFTAVEGASPTKELAAAAPTVNPSIPTGEHPGSRYLRSVTVDGGPKVWRKTKRDSCFGKAAR